MNSRYIALLDKSLQGALSAIELYNKPNFSYREESFSILMINAWELLLKAKRLKNKLSSRYTDCKFNKSFWDLKRKLENDDQFSGERYLDHTKNSGSKKRYYSSNIYKEFDKYYTKKVGSQT